MDVTLDGGSVLTMGPGTIEGPSLPDFRWLVSPRNDSERVLQQAVRMQRGNEYWIEWRNVPEVQADETIDPT